MGFPEDPGPLETTVAICTRDRRESLLRLLGSLSGQRGQLPWEVVVVDNGSRDGTREAAAARGRSLPAPFRIVSEPVRGVSRARNRALHEARGRVVLFTDDDVTCLPGWLESYQAAFSDGGVVGAGGPIRPVLPPGTPASLLPVLGGEVGGPTSRYEFGSEPGEIVAGGPISLPFGANMGILRRAGLAQEGFRTDLGWGRGMVPSEDVEFMGRLRRAGRMRYVPGAAVQHHVLPGRTSLRYWQRWQRGYGRSTVRLAPPADARERARLLLEGLTELRRLQPQLRRAHSGGDIAREFELRRQRARLGGRLLELARL